MNDGEQPAPGRDERAKPTIASRIAVLSFASGLVFCCPGTSLLALIAGVAALLIGLREVHASWRKFAIGGMLLGLTSLVVLVVLYFIVNGRWEREWRILYTGPNNALVALYAGSFADFRAEFTGSAAGGTDAEIQAFATNLREHLGQFSMCRSIRQTAPELDGPGPWELGEYEAVFTVEGNNPWTGAVPVRIGINRLSSGTLRLEWVLIEGAGPHDENVRIRYPAEPVLEVPSG